MIDVAYVIESADTRISDACPDMLDQAEPPKHYTRSPRHAYKKCVCCGQEYEPSGSRTRYCDECMIELKIVTMRKCAVCGAEFAAKNIRHKYCSEKCAEKSKRQLNRSYKDAHKDNNTAVSPTYEQELLNYCKPSKTMPKISEISRLARASGMSYGEYVARCER